MSATLTIDQKLYRPLKSGAEYEGLIPVFNKVDYKFDDTESINTYDTLKYMSEWAKKYSYQTQKLAQKLKGRTVEETVNNIYQFLFWHFQYKLDGQLQNLFAPSAAWFYRHQGFDCKTYSLLASCILQNLNISHCFRMVQQQTVMPGQWSHVYAIVKENGREYVIDATKRENTEVKYTKKHDMNIHRGLACPCESGLGGIFAPGSNIFGNIAAGTASAFGGNSNSNTPSSGGFWGAVNNVSGGNIGGVNVGAIQGVFQGTQPISGLINNVSVGGVNGSQIMNVFNGVPGSTGSAVASLTGNMSVAGINASSIARAVAGDPTAIIQVAQQALGKLSGKLSIAGLPLSELIGNPMAAFGILHDVFKQFSNISKLKCLGGSAFDQTQLNDVKANLDTYVTNQIIKINIFARSGKLIELSVAISEFFAVTDMSKKILSARTAEGFNTCTRGNLYAASDYAYQLNTVLGAGLSAWAEKYFPLDLTNNIAMAKLLNTKEVLMSKQIETTLYSTLNGDFANKFKIPWTETSQKIESISPSFKRIISPTETTLLAFEPSQYLGTFTAATVGDFSKETFLNTLKTVLAQKAPEVAPTAPTAPESKSKSSFLPLAAVGLAAKLLFFS